MRNFALTLLCTIAFSCKAATLYSPQFKTCMDKSGGVTIEMIDCMNAELKIQDSKLNANYKALLASLSEPRKKDFIEAQRAWLRYRELNCKFYLDPEGGSLARIEANDCFLRLTAERATELKSLPR